MKTTMLFAIILFLLTLAALKMFSQPATLAWDRSPTPNVNYRVKWGTSSNNVAEWTGFYDSANPTNHFLNNGPWGAWYFVVTAVTTNNVESLPSNMIYFTNTPAAPLRLRMLPDTNRTVRIEGTTDGNNWIHLATVTSKDAPATIQSASKGMMIRTVQLPPLP